jgi:hypothetical protein
MNDLERDFVGDDEVHYESDHDAEDDAEDDSVYDDMPGLINYEDSSDHSHIMNLYGDFNRFNDNDYDCEEIKEELEAELDTDLDTELKFDLNTELDTETHGELDTETHGELETGLKNEMNEVHPEPAINREIEVSPKQTKSFCIIC